MKLINNYWNNSIGIFVLQVHMKGYLNYNLAKYFVHHNYNNNNKNKKFVIVTYKFDYFITNFFGSAALLRLHKHTNDKHMIITKL